MDGLKRSTSKLILGLTFAGICFIGAAIALSADVFLNVPDFTQMRQSIAVVQAMPGGKTRVRQVGPKAPGWVPIQAVSHNLLMAVVASEDTSFFSHEGVDYHELREALKKDLQERKFARGGSTITQQVVKNAFLDRSKTIWRKIREFIWAREMDRKLTKSQILEFYVNLVEWGPGIYGIREASQHYFSIAPSQLSAKQGAFLAMLLPSPVKYHQYYTQRRLTKWAAQRVRQILNVMQSMRFIEPASYQLALTEPLWGNSDSEPALTSEEGSAATLPTEDTGLAEPPITDIQTLPSASSPTPEVLEITPPEPTFEGNSEDLPNGGE